MVVAIALVGCHSSVDLFGEDDGRPLEDAGPALDLTVPADGSTTACRGSAPKCYVGWSGRPACCLEPGTNASCIEGEWNCPPDTFSERECRRTDPVCEGTDGGPPPPIYDDCEVSSDCVLTGVGCCGICERPTAADVVAVNGELAEDYRLDVACVDGDPALCPGCLEVVNPHLKAVCDTSVVRAQCTVVDLEDDAFVECESSADCMLAQPTCCPCGEISAFETIAVRRDVDLVGLFCDEEMDCECEPEFDEALGAVCSGGRCDALAIGSP